MPRKPLPPEESPALKKFRDSMIMDFDKWKEGTGYDMATFATLQDAEKQIVIKEIRGKNKSELDWRDMEVLKYDNSKESFDHLRDMLVDGTCDQRAHALSDLYDMNRMNDSAFDVQLSHILDDVTDDDGVTATLLLVDEDAGPKTREALERGVRERPDIALHYAAKLLDIAGLADDNTAAFDPKLRPTLLKLLPSEKPSERAKAIELVFTWLGSGKK
jgi:hypothetical protein